MAEVGRLRSIINSLSTFCQKKGHFIANNCSVKRCVSKRWGLNLLLSVFFGCLLSACEPSPAAIKLHGPTMGTTYNIQYVAYSDSPSQKAMDEGTRQVLKDINQLMSTYIPDSELSRFNVSTTQNQWFPLSKQTWEVISMSLDISRMTQGRYDVTVGPLVNLWGFGKDPHQTPPNSEQLESIMTQVGFQSLELQDEPPALKSAQSREVNLSSIAKGYAVDQLAEWLESQGIQQYLVEVGGEMRVSGKKVDGSSWRIAIESPVANDRKIHKVLELENVGIATSGNYRNFFEWEGVRYSHVLDAKTGWPVKHQLASVTVIAENCAKADGLATALLVMGLEDGLALAKKENIMALFIAQNADDGEGESFTEYMSPQFLQRFGTQ